MLNVKMRLAEMVLLRVAALYALVCFCGLFALMFLLVRVYMYDAHLISFPEDSYKPFFQHAVAVLIFVWSASTGKWLHKVKLASMGSVRAGEDGYDSLDYIVQDMLYRRKMDDEHESPQNHDAKIAPDAHSNPHTQGSASDSDQGLNW